MKVYITGVSGQLGGELQRLFPEAIYLSRAELDLSSAESIESYFQNNKADLIINCGAYTQVDLAEKESELAYAINTVAPATLAKFAEKFIHVSTDYVFDGQSHRPYQEDSETGATGVYGDSKLRGERAVLAANPNAVIIRTSWVYSDLGKNFVKTILRVANQKSEIRVVTDQIGSPTYAYDLAKVIFEKGIKHWQFRSGIYHYSNEGVCSWFDFAYEIVKMSGLTCKVTPIPSEEYPTPAKRPHFSVLDKRKIKHDLQIEIPHWKESLAVCLRKLS